MVENLLNWFGVCDHSYIVESQFTSFKKDVIFSVNSTNIRMKHLYYNFHMCCNKCGNLKTHLVTIKNVAYDSDHNEFLTQAKSSLSLKYKIRNKF